MPTVTGVIEALRVEWELYQRTKRFKHLQNSRRIVDHLQVMLI